MEGHACPCLTDFPFPGQSRENHPTHLPGLPTSHTYHLDAFWSASPRIAPARPLLPSGSWCRGLLAPSEGRKSSHRSRTASPATRRLLQEGGVQRHVPAVCCSVFPAWLCYCYRPASVWRSREAGCAHGALFSRRRRVCGRLALGALRLSCGACLILEGQTSGLGQ